MKERFITAMSTFGQHAPFLFTLVLLPQLPFMALGSMAILLGESGAILSLIVATGSVLVTPLWLGATFHALRRMGIRGEIEVSEAYRVGLLLYPRTLPAFMLSMLAVMAGAICFLLPGIYIGVRLGLVNCVALFEKHEPMGALRRAWQLSSGHTLEILAYLGLLGVPAFLISALEAVLAYYEPAPATVALFVFVSQLVFMLLSIIYLCLIYEVYMAVAGPQPIPAPAQEPKPDAGGADHGTAD